MIEKEYMINNIPILMVKKDIDIDKIKGTILFFHGFMGKKEDNYEILKKLALDGYISIGIDNYDHGKRRPDNFQQKYSFDNPKIEELFLGAVIKTSKEVPYLINELKKKKIIKGENIGIAGVSMGGYITYTAITIDKRIKVAASIIGSPKYKLDIPESPHKYISKFNKIKLLSQNATNDEIVLTEDTRNFHRELDEYYSDYSERFKYIEYPNSGHMMDIDDWEFSIYKLRKWFQKYL